MNASVQNSISSCAARGYSCSQMNSVAGPASVKIAKDVLFERCELREATFSSIHLQGAELRGCDLVGLRGAESLRGARMPFNDVLANAVLFASVAGIEIVD